MPESGPSGLVRGAGGNARPYRDSSRYTNMALRRYPGRGDFMISRFIPDGPEQTREEFDFLFETATPNAAEDDAIRYIDVVLQREDIDIVKSVQRGMHSPGFTCGPYLIDPTRSGLSEHGVHHLHSMIAKATVSTFVCNSQANDPDASLGRRQ